MGSSSATVLPTIKSVADAPPYSNDYRAPFAEALVGTLATGPEISAYGFNPGTAAYEIVAQDDEAVIRFDGFGGGRGGLRYYQPAIEMLDFFVDEANVVVERAIDGGATFQSLNPGEYNLTTQAEEAEVGAGRRGQLPC